MAQLETGTLSVPYVSLLAAQLPKGARVFIKINPNAEFSISDQALSNIEFMLASVVYGLAGLKKKGVPAPTPRYPVEVEDTPAYLDEYLDDGDNWHNVEAYPIDEIAAFVEENMRGGEPT